MKNLSIFIILLLFQAECRTQYYLSSSDDTQIYIREFGKGEPLIFLAGGPGFNADYLKPVWEQLSSDFRCIVLDQRGTGKSILNSVDSVSLTLNNYVEDIEALRNHLKLKNITLVGHSWGGMLAMEYAAQKTSRVKKLILLNPGGPTSQFTSYFSDNIQMRLHTEDKLSKEELDSLGKPYLWSIYPGYFFDRNKAISIRDTTDFKLILGQPGVSNYVMPSYFSVQADRVNLLKKYTGPVYIIQGRQDPIGESTVYEIKELLPQTDIHFIEKSGHFPWLENDDQIFEFFEQVNQSLK